MKTLKEKIAEGKIVNGTMLRVLRNPAVAYLADQAGLDFLMFDCEHANYSLETMHDINLTARALGISCMARVPYLREEYIGLILEAGLEGIQVPMVETAEQAAEIVRCAKFPPIGERGFAAKTANTCYRGIKPTELMRADNQRVVVIAQIESKRGVENVDAIASVDGVDCLLVGPNDLSISLGVPGDTMNPIELEALAKVADACQAHNKLFALHAGAGMCDLFKDQLSLNIQNFDSDFIVNGMRAIVEYGQTFRR